MVPADVANQTSLVLFAHTAEIGLPCGCGNTQHQSASGQVPTGGPPIPVDGPSGLASAGASRLASTLASSPASPAASCPMWLLEPEPHATRTPTTTTPAKSRMD